MLKRTRSLASAGFLALTLRCLLSTSAWAYLDPGTGFTFASGILGMIVGFFAMVFGFLAFTFKRWWAWLMGLFRKSSKK